LSRYTVQLTSKAGDWLRAQRDAKLQARIIAATERLADNPHPPGCVKLSGVDDVWRIRVGDYRIL
jgi:mRNA interferase RelE/StbE